MRGDQPEEEERAWGLEEERGGVMVLLDKALEAGGLCPWVVPISASTKG